MESMTELVTVELQEETVAEEVQDTWLHVTKTLATCTGIEFLQQTNRIRHEVEGWIKETKVLEIRKRKAAKKPITDDMSPEEKQATQAANEAARMQQVRQNISDMLDACLETHAEQTLRLLAMLCFIDKEDANNVPVTELLAAFGDMLGDEGVMRFFTSLTKWEVINTSK